MLYKYQYDTVQYDILYIYTVQFEIVYRTVRYTIDMHNMQYDICSTSLLYSAKLHK